MPFVSIFEQAILDRRNEILNQKKLVQEIDQQLLILRQQNRECCLQGIALALKLKFPVAGPALFADIQKQTDLDWLRRFLASIEAAASVEDLRRLLP